MDSVPTEAILIIEDDENARILLSRILEGYGYHCVVAADAPQALRCIDEHDFALVLADMALPGKSGLQIIEEIIHSHPDTGTIMITGSGDRNLAKMVIETGAYGYISKPVDGDELFVSVVNALHRRNLERENRAHRERLEEAVRVRTQELWQSCVHLELAQRDLQASREETIHRLALVAEYRDTETAQHVKRMSRYCEVLARALGHDQEASEEIRLASMLHDIGKIGTPATILLKTGPLEPEERAIIERHPGIGYSILSESRSKVLQTAATIALTHHEHWDGDGYPAGMCGESIPFEGRIAAIADVFDAVTSDRPYRNAMALPAALGVMKQGRGTHFEPKILDLFFQSLSDIFDIKEEHRD